MPRTRIKICGVRDIETALTAVDAGADAVGLVFVEKSPRFVSADIAAEIVDALPAFVEAVGLFMDASADTIRRIVTRTGLRTIQLHGREPVSILDELDGLHIIRAMPADELAEVYARPWIAHRGVRAMLFDTPPAQHDELTGGSGKSFDWGLLRQSSLRAYEYLCLAGGLTPDNVGQAVQSCSPYAVDVSSGVESTRGVKSPALIHAFCDAVRSADAS